MNKKEIVKEIESIVSELKDPQYMGNQIDHVLERLGRLSLHVKAGESRKLLREIKERNIELWTLKRPESEYGSGARDILEIVDTSSGKITSYEKTGERIHPNMTPEALKEDNFVFTQEYFGANGFKRLRLVEGALIEKEETF